MSGALAIFVKTPGLSTVKSRLAAEWGEHLAVGWYRQAAYAVASVARVARTRYGVSAYWAVAEADAESGAVAFDAWPGLPVIAQPAGDLGTRMAHVHAGLVAQHGFGLLLGADAPQLTAELLGDAAEWLAAPIPRLVLGPAHDGGFWLFGGNVAPPLPMWKAVTYSAPETAQHLYRAMQGTGEWLTLATLTDVDHMSDLAAVRVALQALTDPTAEQRVLAYWMHRHENLSA